MENQKANTPSTIINEEIVLENTTDIANKICEIEKEEILLLREKNTYQLPLTEINNKLEILKREKSILNKKYWLARS